MQFLLRRRSAAAALVLSIGTLGYAPIAAGQSDELWYGVYIEGLNLGALHFVIEERPDGLILHGEASMAIAANAIETTDTLAFSPDGRLVSYLATAAETTSTETKATTLDLARDQSGRYAWTRRELSGAAPQTTHGELTVPRGAVSESLLPVLIARSSWSASDWSRQFSIVDEKLPDIWIAEAELLGDNIIDVRGRRVEAQVIAVDAERGAGITRVYVADGRPVRIEYREPIVALLGSEAEARAHLVRLTSEPEVVEAAEGIILSLGLGDADRLRELVDIAELHRRWGERDRSIERLSEGIFARRFFDGVAGEAGQQDEAEVRSQAALIRVVSSVERRGDAATLRIPGEKEPMEFRRGRDRSWRLTWWGVLSR